jgi:DNA-binding transcriptional LysR family regulator
MAFFATAGALLVPRALAALRAEHEGIDVHLTEGDPEETMALLRDRAVELALVYRYPFEDLDMPTHTTLEPVAEDEIMLILSPEHPLAAAPRVGLDELASHDIIQGVAATSPRAVIPVACRRAGFEPRIAFSTTDHMTVQGLAAAGVGVAFTSQLTLPAIRRDLAVRPLRGAPLRRQVFVAIRDVPSPAARVLAGLLRTVAADLLDEASRRFRPEPKGDSTGAGGPAT